MPKTRWGLLAILALAIVMGLAACGGDDNDNDDNTNTAVPAEASSPPPTGIVITNPWIRASTSGMNSAAFMTLQNVSESEERLVNAVVDDTIASVVEIHETTVDANDVMQMRPVDGVTIPAGESVELKPGGLHIMLLELQRDLNEGDLVTLTLTFESGQEMTFELPVRPMMEME